MYTHICITPSQPQHLMDDENLHNSSSITTTTITIYALRNDRALKKYEYLFAGFFNYQEIMHVQSMLCPAVVISVESTACKEMEEDMKEREREMKNMN